MYSTLFSLLILALTGLFGEAAAFDPGSYDNWNFDILDTGIEPTDPSIRIDSQGYPHIAYLRQDRSTRSTRITYAYYSGSSWEFRTVLENYSIKYCFLALDGNDDPCIVFQSGSRPYTISYATPVPGGGWSIVEIASSANNGYLKALDSESNGNSHVIYYDACSGSSEKDLHHLFFNGSAWVNEIVWWFGDGAGCFGVSQALTSQNEPCLAHYNAWWGFIDSKNSWVRPCYTVRSGGSWSYEYLGDYWGDQTDIALTTGDLPRIVFQDGSELCFASSNGSTWQITNVDPAHEASEYCAIASDGSDTPPIAYHDSVNDDLRYAWSSGSSWNTTLLDSDGEVGIAPDIAVDGNGNPFIIYNDVTNHQLKLAWFGDPTGVNSHESGGVQNLSIHGVTPNPARNFLSITVSLSIQTEVSVSIFDLSGRLVRRAPIAICEEGVSELSLDITGLERGVYFVQASDGQLSKAVEVTVLP